MVMKIELNLYASLAKFIPGNTRDKSCVMEISEDTAVKELLDGLKIPGDSIKIIFLNGVHAGSDAILRDGDRLGVFPPVAGG